MKIYLDLQKQAITKTTDEKTYEGDFYSNVFEVLFYNYTDSNWFPTMSQLAPNGRKAGEFTADALNVGESHTYVEDGVTYLKFDFTMGANWVLMKGRSEFYIWFNRLGGAIVQKKCVGVVNVMIDQSTTDYFIADPTFNPNVKAYIDACIAELGDGSPKYFDTASNIANCTEDKGLAVATDTGHLYYWDETKNSTTKYTDSGLVYNDLSAYYTITQMDALLAQKVNKADVADNLTTNDSDKVLSAKQGYVLKAMLDALEAATYTKQEVNTLLVPTVSHDGNQLKDKDGNNIYPNIADGSVSAEKTNFIEFYGTNVLDNSTVSSNKIWKRQYGNPSTIFQTDNTDGFCFQPIELKKNIDYYLTPCRFSNTLILIGTWDSATTAYTGTYYTIENCPFATYTAGSTAGFGTAKITPTSDCILFFSSTTLLDIGQPSTAMVFKGDELPSEFVPYGQYLSLIIPQLETPLKFNKTLLVSKNNNFGGYSSIQEAIDNANDGDTIIVYPDEYYETVVCIDKEINIVGISKEKCVLWYDSDNYVGGMPLSIAYGSVQNMTIKAVRATETTTSTNLPYAVHIDYNSQQNKTLKFDNVDMIGGWQASCGIGLKGGFNLSFKNCNFIADRDTPNGALFFHDNTISGYNGTSSIIFDTCNIINKNGTIAIMPASYGNTENTTNMKFLRTCIYSSLGGKTNACVGVGRAVIGSGWRQYNNFFLDDDSYGNNIELFNA